MRYYYIDSENVVASAWCECIKHLNGQDVLVIIRTVNSKEIDIKYIPLIVGCKCKIEVVDACVGTKNALDFVLVSELTKHAMSARKSQHIVVSADKGYQPVILRLKQQGVGVWQVSSINSNLVNKLKSGLDLKPFTKEELTILSNNGIHK